MRRGAHIQMFVFKLINSINPTYCFCPCSPKGLPSAGSQSHSHIGVVLVVV